MDVQVARQTTMFDEEGTPSHDAEFTSARRVVLSRGAWVDVVPGWLRGEGVLYDAVLRAADWQVWSRPMFDRVVAQPRLSVSWADTALPPALGPVRPLVSALSARYGVRLTRVSANLYRDGRDSVAWHGDTHLRDLPTATVAVLSLGSPRSFRLRPRGGGPSIGWALGHGDLVVMGGTCQRTWQHAVPKVARAGPRICLMFRTADVDGLVGRTRGTVGTAPRARTTGQDAILP